MDCNSLIIIMVIMFGLIVFLGIKFVEERNKNKKIGSNRIGNLRIDTLDPEGPYLFLELDSNIFRDKESIRSIAGMKEVVLEVKELRSHE